MRSDLSAIWIAALSSLMINAVLIAVVAVLFDGPLQPHELLTAAVSEERLSVR